MSSGENAGWLLLPAVLRLAIKTGGLHCAEVEARVERKREKTGGVVVLKRVELKMTSKPSRLIAVRWSAAALLNSVTSVGGLNVPSAFRVL